MWLNHGVRMKKARSMKKVKPVPDGYHTVTPYLACGDAAKAITFYKQAFGAKELLRIPGPGGKVGHAELRIGDSRVMLADEYREMDFLSPLTRGGSAVHLHIYVTNADKTVERAVAAGAKVVQPLQDKFYGDRTGSVQDPFGHVWHIATHVEDVPPRELKKRAEKMMKDKSG
jgi:PhnB protein